MWENELWFTLSVILTNEIQEIKTSDKDIQRRETALGWRMYEDLQNITNELYNVLEKIN